MKIMNDSLIEHLEETEDVDPNLIMNVLLNLIMHYSNLMGVDPAFIFQQGINSAGGSNSSIGGIDLEFE